MIGKNIDLIAVGALLAGAAIYSGAREMTFLQVAPYNRVAFSQAIQRVMHCSRTTRAASTININRAAVTPWGSPKITVYATTD